MIIYRITNKINGKIYKGRKLSKETKEKMRGRVPWNKKNQPT